MKKSVFSPAALRILSAGSLWGFMSIFVRNLGARGFSSLQMVSARAMVSTVILLGLLLLRRKGELKVHPKDLWVFAGTGLASMVFFNWCYFTTISLGDAGVAVVLLYTSPIWVMLLSALLFKEKLTAKKFLALGITFLGCLCSAGFTGGAAMSLPVFFIGLGSGLGYGLYSIFGMLAVKRGYSSMTTTFWTFLFAVLGCLLLTPPGEVLRLTFQSPSAMAWVAGIAVFATVLPYLLYTKGLEGMEPGRAAVMAAVEPPVGAMVGILVWGEPLTLQKVLGVGLIFLAVALLNNKNK